MDVVRISKRLSYVLRHRPDRIGIVLDDAGWVDVDALLDALAASGRPVTRAELEHVVATNDKRRFALDASACGASPRFPLGTPPSMTHDEEPVTGCRLVLLGAGRMG